MRPSSLAVAIAMAGCGTVHAAGTFITLQTRGAQTTKVSQNGEYLSAYVRGTGGVRWTRSTGAEELVPDMDFSNGINNLGTVSGVVPVDGGIDNGGLDIPALSPVSASAPHVLTLPAGVANTEVFDVSDDGTAVGIAFDSDYVTTAAYYWTAAGGAIELPVDNAAGGTRANAISADGRVVAGFNDGTNGFRRGVVWVDRIATYVQKPDGASLGAANAVSGNGAFVVGRDYPMADGSKASWRWNVETGEVTPIPGIPSVFGVSDDGQTVVGATGQFDSPSVRLFIWTEAGGTQPFSDYLTAQGVNIPLPLPLKGSLTSVSGDGSTIGGWLYTSAGIRSFVVLLNLPDRIFEDGFDTAP